MNSNPQNHPQSSVPSSEPSNSSLQPSTFAGYRGNGKIARLPKPVRDNICNWMLDGVSYPDIIQRLGEHGKDLNPGHLCEWRKRGYQDWLLQQAWLAQTRARQEPAAELSADFDATQLNHAALQLGTLQIFEAFRDLAPSPSCSSSFSPPADSSDSSPDESQQPLAPPLPSGEGQAEGNGSVVAPSTSPTEVCSPNPKSKIQNQKSPRPRSQLDLRLGGDSAAFVRLINALARASRETMLLQKYREACARARVALRELRDPKRKLTDDERRAIVRNVDDILGLSSEDEQESTVQGPENQVQSSTFKVQSPEEEQSSVQGPQSKVEENTPVATAP